MAVATPVRRRPMTPSSRNIRILLLRSDPLFTQRTTEGLADVEAGRVVGYEEFRSECEAHLAKLR